MKEMLVDKVINSNEDVTRSHLVAQLRVALTAALTGENEVTIMFEGNEITWQLKEGEWFVIG